SLIGRAAAVRDERLLARYVDRHPSTAGYAAFADFKLYRVEIDRAHLVAGFGKIHWVDGAEIRLSFRESPSPPAGGGGPGGGGTLRWTWRSGPRRQDCQPCDRSVPARPPSPCPLPPSGGEGRLPQQVQSLPHIRLGRELGALHIHDAEALTRGRFQYPP